MQSNRLIEELARQFRATLDDLDWGCIGKANDFPKGCCHLASDMLIDYLESNGVSGARMARGHYESDIENTSHYWVEVSDLAVDITADQFNFCDAPVIVQPISAWHEQVFKFCRMDIDRTTHVRNPHLGVLRESLKENITRRTPTTMEQVGV